MAQVKHVHHVGQLGFVHKLQFIFVLQLSLLQDNFLFALQITTRGLKELHLFGRVLFLGSLPDGLVLVESHTINLLILLKLVLDATSLDNGQEVNAQRQFTFGKLHAARGTQLLQFRLQNRSLGTFLLGLQAVRFTLLFNFVLHERYKILKLRRVVDGLVLFLAQGGQLHLILLAGPNIRGTSCLDRFLNVLLQLVNLRFQHGASNVVLGLQILVLKQSVPQLLFECIAGSLKGLNGLLSVLRFPGRVLLQQGAGTGHGGVRGLSCRLVRRHLQLGRVLALNGGHLGPAGQHFSAGPFRHGSGRPRGFHQDGFVRIVHPAQFGFVLRRRVLQLLHRLLAGSQLFRRPLLLQLLHSLGPIFSFLLRPLVESVQFVATDLELGGKRLNACIHGWFPDMTMMIMVAVLGVVQQVVQRAKFNLQVGLKVSDKMVNAAGQVRRGRGDGRGTLVGRRECLQLNAVGVTRDIDTSVAGVFHHWCCH
jgi:hypothetical protein